MSGILQTIAEDPTAPIFDLIKEGRVTVWEGPVFGLTTSVKYTDFLHLADVDVAPKPLGACLVSVKWKESGVKYKGASGAHAFREVVRTAITAAFPAFAPRVRRRNPNSGEKPRSQVFTEQALQQGDVDPKETLRNMCDIAVEENYVCSYAFVERVRCPTVASAFIYMRDLAIRGTQPLRGADQTVSVHVVFGVGRVEPASGGSGAVYLPLAGKPGAWGSEGSEPRCCAEAHVLKAGEGNKKQRRGKVAALQVFQYMKRILTTAGMHMNAMIQGDGGAAMANPEQLAAGNSQGIMDNERVANAKKALSRVVQHRDMRHSDKSKDWEGVMEALSEEIQAGVETHQGSGAVSSLRHVSLKPLRILFADDLAVRLFAHLNHRFHLGVHLDYTSHVVRAVSAKLPFVLVASVPVSDVLRQPAGPGATWEQQHPVQGLVPLVPPDDGRQRKAIGAKPLPLWLLVTGANDERSTRFGLAGIEAVMASLGGFCPYYVTSDMGKELAGALVCALNQVDVATYIDLMAGALLGGTGLPKRPDGRPFVVLVWDASHVMKAVLKGLKACPAPGGGRPKATPVWLGFRSMQLMRFQPNYMSAELLGAVLMSLLAGPSRLTVGQEWRFPLSRRHLSKYQKDALARAGADVTAIEVEAPAPEFLEAVELATDEELGAEASELEGAGRHAAGGGGSGEFFLTGLDTRIPFDGQLDPQVFHLHVRRCSGPPARQGGAAEATGDTTWFVHVKVRPFEVSYIVAIPAPAAGDPIVVPNYFRNKDVALYLQKHYLQLSLYWVRCIPGVPKQAYTSTQETGISLLKVNRLCDQAYTLDRFTLTMAGNYHAIFDRLEGVVPRRSAEASAISANRQGYLRAAASQHLRAYPQEVAGRIAEQLLRREPPPPPAWVGAPAAAAVSGEDSGAEQPGHTYGVTSSDSGGSSSSQRPAAADASDAGGAGVVQPSRSCSPSSSSDGGGAYACPVEVAGRIAEQPQRTPAWAAAVTAAPVRGEEGGAQQHTYGITNSASSGSRSGQQPAAADVGGGGAGVVRPSCSSSSTDSGSASASAGAASRPAAHACATGPSSAGAVGYRSPGMMLLLSRRGGGVATAHSRGRPACSHVSAHVAHGSARRGTWSRRNMLDKDVTWSQQLGAALAALQQIDSSVTNKLLASEQGPLYPLFKSRVSDQGDVLAAWRNSISEKHLEKWRSATTTASGGSSQLPPERSAIREALDAYIQLVKQRLHRHQQQHSQDDLQQSPLPGRQGPRRLPTLAAAVAFADGAADEGGTVSIPGSPEQLFPLPSRRPRRVTLRSQGVDLMSLVPPFDQRQPWPLLRALLKGLGRGKKLYMRKVSVGLNLRLSSQREPIKALYQQIRDRFQGSPTASDRSTDGSDEDNDAAEHGTVPDNGQGRAPGPGPGSQGGAAARQLSMQGGAAPPGLGLGGLSFGGGALPAFTQGLERQADGLTLPLELLHRAPGPGPGSQGGAAARQLSMQGGAAPSGLGLGGLSFGGGALPPFTQGLERQADGLTLPLELLHRAPGPGPGSQGGAAARQLSMQGGAAPSGLGLGGLSFGGGALPAFTQGLERQADGLTLPLELLHRAPGPGPGSQGGAAARQLSMQGGAAPSGLGLGGLSFGGGALPPFTQGLERQADGLTLPLELLHRAPGPGPGSQGGAAARQLSMQGGAAPSGLGLGGLSFGGGALPPFTQGLERQADGLTLPLELLHRAPGPGPGSQGGAAARQLSMQGGAAPSGLGLGGLSFGGGVLPPFTQGLERQADGLTLPLELLHRALGPGPGSQGSAAARQLSMQGGAALPGLGLGGLSYGGGTLPFTQGLERQADGLTLPLELLHRAPGPGPGGLPPGGPRVLDWSDRILEFERQLGFQ
ncbi:hypothetical protein CHLRE_16g653934v5 [Chlamydomonas reinhardtii]|uniref:Uncharacterized protein n=1 Tax=Chlamydomonas reinhardtii TaxID=3055 RepID=A0A2K3CT31_CHLRE|nr:uncharacterized protein CHLRE_16g653934v5 [Chlamydomonas reinhardtii]PNW71429.1 hypothetical protein CHLRE_16g653934v5 [Chlamydomonas reinhardtii]